MHFHRPRALIAICLAWLVITVCYGWDEVSSTMTLLRITPSPDLYANDLGFQVAAFVLTKGLVSLLVLGVMLLVGASVTGSNKVYPPR